MSNTERWRRFAPLSLDIQQQITQLTVLFQGTDIELAYLFGSLATGQDVDLALLTTATPVHRLHRMIMQCLATERLDLIDLQKASPLLRFEIISSGRLIYAISDEIENQFELETLHQYRDTAPMRIRQEQILRERINSWSSNAHQLSNG